METLDSSMVSSGAACSSFEEKHAALLNKNYGIACGSGTQGLVAILKHLKIGMGDQVILPSYVCDKVEKGILAVGASPVLCDISHNWVMDYNSIKSKISSQTKAIVLVHIFGINAFSESLLEFNIPIIEDICQSTGTWNHTYGPGSYTNFAFTSFHATKCITTGQGGMVFGNNPESEDAIRESIGNDFLNDYSDLQASLGLAQLMEYEFVLNRRKTISNQYLNELNPALVGLTQSLDSMYFRFPITTRMDFATAKQEFEKEGIAIRKGVDALIHRKNGIPDAEFPITTELFETTISLPILPHFMQEQIDHIILNTNKILG